MAHRGCPQQRAEPLQGQGEGDRFRDCAESRRRIEADFSRAEVDRGVEAREPFELNTRLHGKDGIYCGFPARYNPLVEEGRARRWYLSATDIESRKQEEERIRQENARLEERTRIARNSMTPYCKLFRAPHYT